MYNISQILNFGGDLKPVNCGADNIYIALNQAVIDPLLASDDVPDGSQEQMDYYNASEENQKSYHKFK